MKARVRAEQDFYLGFGDRKEATEAERVEFLRYDSTGGAIANDNPVYVGKKRYGQYGEMMRGARLDTDGGWVGGVNLLGSYPVRALKEWFGSEDVERWVREVFR